MAGATTFESGTCTLQLKAEASPDRGTNCAEHDYYARDRVPAALSLTAALIIAAAVLVVLILICCLVLWCRRQSHGRCIEEDDAREWAATAFGEELVLRIDLVQDLPPRPGARRPAPSGEQAYTPRTVRALQQAKVAQPAHHADTAAPGVYVSVRFEGDRADRTDALHKYRSQAVRTPALPHDSEIAAFGQTYVSIPLGSRGVPVGTDKVHLTLTSEPDFAAATKSSGGTPASVNIGAANPRGPGKTCRTPWHRVEDPVGPIQIGKAP
jgi:hypothetical protein